MFGRGMSFEDLDDGEAVGVLASPEGFCEVGLELCVEGFWGWHVVVAYFVLYAVRYTFRCVVRCAVLRERAAQVTAE